MRLIISAITVFLLIGCATEVTDSPSGSRYFEIRQHFSSSSELEANSLAQSRCLMRNSRANLVNFEKGGLFNFSGRGGEYSLYTYECIRNLSDSEDNQRLNGAPSYGRGNTNESESALEEARRAREEARLARQEIPRMREKIAQEKRQADPAKRQAELERSMEQFRRQNQKMMDESWRRP